MKRGKVVPQHRRLRVDLGGYKEGYEPLFGTDPKFGAKKNVK